MENGKLKDFTEMSIRVKDGKVEILDQRELPYKEIWLTSNSAEDMSNYIKWLAVRGAPLIGCAAALVIAQHALTSGGQDTLKVSEYLKSARPTAVNLMYCCDAMAQVNLAADKRDYSPENLVRIAIALLKHEEEMCAKMAKLGASLVQDGDNILTHCNTGSLATLGVGTALGVIREAHRSGKKIHVYVDETRPLLQGGRLTAYELQKEKIPYTLICDNMAATLMRQGKIQRIFVGADRIAMNGDFANKIGTYSVAVIAKHHGVPFYPVAPLSTVDFACKTGNDIPIEERKREEVLGAFGTTWAPLDAQTFNPAFDVTPIELVDSLILDSGIHTSAMIQKGSLVELKHKQH